MLFVIFELLGRVVYTLSAGPVCYGLWSLSKVSVLFSQVLKLNVRGQGDRRNCY